jgi:hypothetical protein
MLLKALLVLFAIFLIAVFWRLGLLLCAVAWRAWGKRSTGMLVVRTNRCLHSS